jgi:methanogenic corrinoid protein MtbC1
VPGFDAPILVGGAAVPDEHTAESVGADGYARDLSQAVQEANRLLGR